MPKVKDYFSELPKPEPEPEREKYEVSFRAAVEIEFDSIVDYHDFFHPDDDNEKPTDDRIAEYVSRYLPLAADADLNDRAWAVLNLMEEWGLMHDDENVLNVELKWEIQ